MQSDGVIVDSGAMTAALQPLERMPRWWQRTGTSPFTIVKPSFGLKRRSWMFEGAECCTLATFGTWRRYISTVSTRISTETRKV
jgi:hypothetical protein